MKRRRCWAQFEAALSAPHLRAYLKQLPDFEDVEAEERALNYIQAHPNIHAALSFLANWPDQRRAADLVMNEREHWDGNRWYFLPGVAESLAGQHPMAATVLLRVLILNTMTGAKAKRYKHAARHLMECESLTATINAYGAIPSHDEFVASLKQQHPRKSEFWSLIPAAPS